MSVVPLTYRQLTREDNFFLVEYHEDGVLQVRGRGFVHSAEKITVGSSYTVQYGLTVRQSTLAKILATGSEQDMRAEKTKREKPTQKQQPNKQPATTRKPSQKRRKEQESSKENAKPSKKPAKKRASFVRACPPPPSGPANTPAPEPTTPRTDDQPIDDFDDSTIPRALPPLRPVPREESVSAAPAAAMTTEPTIQQTTATSTEPTMHQGSTPTMQQTTATSSEPTLQQASTPTTEPTIQQEEATLTAADIADSVLNSIRPRPPLQELRVNERPPMPTTERRPSVGSSGTALTSRRDSASPVQTPRESPLPGRTPFRPMRPANSGNVNQLQYSVNVCIEQLREYNKNNNENKKAVAATNRRITELESTVTRVETKIDQLMLMFAQQGQSNIGANNGTAANAHTTGAYATVEEIAPHLRVPSETLTLTHRKSHGAGHFASLLLPVIFPELFGPMRTRLNYNWDGCRAKNPLDAEKKSVLKTYTNMYYPESRTESSWAACVSKINECLRRKYVPKGKQLQGVVHDNDEQVMDCATGDFGEIPTFANDMINNSISDIPTPTFVEGFSNYTNFLNNV